MWDEFDSWVKSLLGSEESRAWDWNDLLYEVEDEDEFERLVARLWEDIGFDAEWTGRGPDGGVDIVARKSGLLNSTTVVIEVKWYQETSVSRPEVQKLQGVRSAMGADKAVFVTSSTFGKKARAWAEQVDGFELVNGRTLLEYLNRSTLTPPEVPYHE